MSVEEELRVATPGSEFQILNKIPNDLFGLAMYRRNQMAAYPKLQSFLVQLPDEDTQARFAGPLAYLFNVSRKNFDRSHLSRPLDTIIGNDVWIGRDATIFAGVTIGDGAVIGANALVNKDVQPYSVVGGIPARQINYRFSESHHRKLLDLRWWEFPDAVILQEINMFYQSNIDAFIAHMSRYKSNT